MQSPRIGIGYDIHRLAPERELILGGIKIPYEKGLLGHSDADVLAHAICDAVLGAAGLGDIGRHFPDDDPKWRNATSIAFIEHAVSLISELGYAVGNVDAVIITERPRLAEYIPSMRQNLAKALRTDVECVSVKAKTNEGLDEVGRGNAMIAHAVVLIARGGSDE
jgi:2-C-methyl-D-erythritol 2,4-cyclodiphosphate synthase